MSMLEIVAIVILILFVGIKLIKFDYNSNDIIQDDDDDPNTEIIRDNGPYSIITTYALTEDDLITLLPIYMIKWKGKIECKETYLCRNKTGEGEFSIEVALHIMDNDIRDFESQGLLIKKAVLNPEKMTQEEKEIIRAFEKILG